NYPPNSVDPTGMTAYHYAFTGTSQLSALPVESKAKAADRSVRPHHYGDRRANGVPLPRAVEAGRRRNGNRLRGGGPPPGPACRAEIHPRAPGAESNLSGAVYARGARGIAAQPPQHLHYPRH